MSCWMTVRHETVIDYSAEVALAHSLVCCAPRDTPWQSCRESDVEVDPLPQALSRRRDWLGNWVTFFSQEQPHRRLRVTARSLVETRAPQLPAASPPWEAAANELRLFPSAEAREAGLYLYPTDRCPFLHELEAYARLSFTPGRPLWEATEELGRRIHDEWTYLPGSTEVDTPLLDVWQGRRGVCQDFAHLMVSCLRCLGLAARYVSGYLLTTPPPGQPRLVGADASHAWVSVWLPDGSWLDYDPTNRRPCGTDHVTLGWGRDYGDVPPLRGVVLGGGHQRVQVAVDVAPVQAPADC